jgi:hypothetical protein
METSLKVLDNPKGGCNTCNSTGCEPCKPAPSVRESAVLLNRRELGLTILGASVAALLAGCSQPALRGKRTHRLQRLQRRPLCRRSSPWFSSRRVRL